MEEENKVVKPQSRKDQRAQEESRAQSRIRKTLVGVGVVCVALAAVMIVSDINTEKSRTVVDKNYDYITNGEEIALPASFGTIEHLAQYKGIEIDKGSVTEVSDVLLDYYIEGEREDDTVVTDITDRAAQLGDFANIDYVGKMDGTAFDGGSATGYELELGSGTFIEGFEDGVVGMNIGDTKTLELKFPDDYSSTELAGKDVQFTVTLNSLQTKVVPEFTDEWVKAHTDGEFSDTATYRADYKTKLEKQFAIYTAYSYGSTAIQDITDASGASATADGVKYLFNSSYELYQDQAVDEGMSLEYYLQNYGTDITTFKQNLAQYSESMSEQVAVMLAIYDAEGMTLTDEDQEALETVLGMTEEEAIAEDGYTQECIELNEKMTKVILFVYDNAVQKPEETTAADTTEAVTDGPGADETAASGADTTKATAATTAAASDAASEASTEAAGETAETTAETTTAADTTAETAAETTTAADTTAETTVAETVETSAAN